MFGTAISLEQDCFKMQHGISGRVLHDSVIVYDKGTRFDDLVVFLQASVFMRLGINTFKINTEEGCLKQIAPRE